VKDTLDNLRIHERFNHTAHNYNTYEDLLIKNGKTANFNKAKKNVNTKLENPLHIQPC